MCEIKYHHYAECGHIQAVARRCGRAELLGVPADRACWGSERVEEPRNAPDKQSKCPGCLGRGDNTKHTPMKKEDFQQLVVAFYAANPDLPAPLAPRGPEPAAPTFKLPSFSEFVARSLHAVDPPPQPKAQYPNVQYPPVPAGREHRKLPGLPTPDEQALRHASWSMELARREWQRR